MPPGRRPIILAAAQDNEIDDANIDGEKYSGVDLSRKFSEEVQRRKEEKKRASSWKDLKPVLGQEEEDPSRKSLFEMKDPRQDKRNGRRFLKPPPSSDASRFEMEDNIFWIDPEKALLVQLGIVLVLLVGALVVGFTGGIISGGDVGVEEMTGVDEFMPQPSDSEGSVWI